MTKQIITEAIKTHRLYFDGGTGSVLQSMGLKPGEAPELWNITNPDKITELHKQYIDAGCDIIKTNTFGVNNKKYENFDILICEAVKCAKKAIDNKDNKYIAFDMGPTGKLLKPMGDLDFEDAVAIFAENAKAAEKYGCDLILIETMNDCYETKAAVLAAKENSSLPIFVTNAYGEDNKLMTGATPLAMLAMLEGMGVDALGLNCSFGPDKMLDIVEELAENASVPIIVNPNAGLPIIVNGKTVYNINPDSFAEYMVKIAQKGGCILGGCCGTTPKHMHRMIESTANIPYTLPEYKNKTLISSYTHAVEIGDSPILIGERINPTGKPKLKEALRAGNMNYVLSEGIKQTDAGVHILDVNVGLPDINEVETIKQAVTSIQAIISTPLQIDSSNTVAIEQAARVYNGKPLINSVNGKKENMEAIFPIVKKYSGAVIALTLDENGIPQTAQERLNIAKHIIDVAKEYGINKKDIIVDPLAMTISSDTRNALVTLESIQLLRNEGIKTSLGVSNISFGLPERDKINSAFFANALQCGLNCAIMNPFSQSMIDVYFAHKALHNLDKSCAEYITYATQNKESTVMQDIQPTLTYCITKGLTNEAVKLAQSLCNEISPIDVINTHVIPALNEVGTAFEQKKIFLPQLLTSAECACAVFDEVKKFMPASDKQNNKKIVLATVKGDIHDIGKNIVKVMLESYGFNVIDLGKDVPPETVCKCALENNCKLVGLSALMTTTVPSMEETIRMLHSLNMGIKTVVGGAVLTQDYADKINADFYAADAMDTVRFAENFYSNY